MQPEETSVYISVTEPVEPLGSTLYLFGQLRSFGSVSDRHSYTTYRGLRLVIFGRIVARLLLKVLY